MRFLVNRGRVVYLVMPRILWVLERRVRGILAQEPDLSLHESLELRIDHLALTQAIVNLDRPGILGIGEELLVFGATLAILRDPVVHREPGLGLDVREICGEVEADFVDVAIGDFLAARWVHPVKIPKPLKRVNISHRYFFLRLVAFLVYERSVLLFSHYRFRVSFVFKDFLKPVNLIF